MLEGNKKMRMKMMHKMMQKEGTEIVDTIPNNIAEMRKSRKKDLLMSSRM